MFGHGTLQDNVYAHMWGNIANMNGHEGAIGCLTVSYTHLTLPTNREV